MITVNTEDLSCVGCSETVVIDKICEDRNIYGMQREMMSIHKCNLMCICLVFCGCGITDPDYTNEILPALIDAPIIKYPIETTSNRDNPGYQTTLSRVEHICSFRDGMLQDVIQPFLDEGISGNKKDGNQIQWKRVPSEDAGSLITLTVTRGDTLHYILEFEGPYWSFTGPWYIEGWVIPGTGRGYWDNGGGISCAWWSTDQANTIAIKYPEFEAIGYTHVVDDSTNGNGSLRWNYPNPLLRYVANWDALGHGNWTSQTEGSGDW